MTKTSRELPNVIEGARQMNRFVVSEDNDCDIGFLIHAGLSCQ